MLVASTLLLILSRPISLPDVTLNLATDAITIVVTVFYVDWVLARHNEEAWRRAENFIGVEAAGVATSFVRDISQHLRMEDRIFPRPAKWDMHTLQDEYLAHLRSLDRFTIEDALSVLPRQRWMELISTVEDRRGDTNSVLSQYMSRMDPDQVESILEFRKQCSRIVSGYFLFEDFLGVPVSDLPKVKDGKPEEYTILATIRLGMQFHDAFDACLGMLENFNFQVEPIDETTEEFQASWDRWRERGGNAAKASS